MEQQSPAAVGGSEKPRDLQNKQHGRQKKSQEPLAVLEKVEHFVPIEMNAVVAMLSAGNPLKGRTGIYTPIHPFSALLLLLVDALWSLPEWVAVTIVVTVPLSFICTSIPVFAIQKTFRKDTTVRALACAAGLGLIAAIPTPLMGTLVGAFILGKAGLNWLTLKKR
jgi:hypothetical protein